VSTTRRLFFSLWPNERQRATLRNVIAPAVHTIDGRAVARANWHLTLLFLGDFPDSAVVGLKRRAAEIPFSPFRLRFDRVEYWPRSRVAVLTPASVPTELARINQALKNLLTDAGFPVEQSQFRPHVTIARNAKPFEVQRLAQPATVEWSGFELLESLSVRGERRYVLV